MLPGRSNNLRSTPPSGTIMTTIPAGGVFAILDGPTCTNNGIAWWKVNYNGAVGWTAEGQFNVYWLEPNTGGPTSAPSPAPGTFGIVGVTATVAPSSSVSCPQTFNFTGQIVVNVGGTVTYRWERSDGSMGATQTFRFAAGGAQSFVDSWTISSNFGGWERLHVLTPNDVSSNQATFTLACGGVAFHVTGVSASVSPAPGTAYCPASPGGTVFTFTGQINVNAAGNVTYHWLRSDGGTTGDTTISASGPGTLGVHNTWQLGTPSYMGWEQVIVTAPDSVASNQANFTTCP